MLHDVQVILLYFRHECRISSSVSQLHLTIICKFKLCACIHLTEQNFGTKVRQQGKLRFSSQKGFLRFIRLSQRVIWGT